MDERPWDPPQYEPKSGMTIPRYANTGEIVGVQRTEQSVGIIVGGFDPNIIIYPDYIRCEIAATSDIVLFFPSMWRLY